MEHREVFLHNLGKRLETVRRSMGFTQRKFAEVLEIPTWSTYYRYEIGKRAIPVDILSRIAELGWNGDWLLTGVGNPELKHQNKKGR